MLLVSGVGVLKKIKPFVPVSNLTSVYQSIVEPYYYSVVFNNYSTRVRWI